MHRRVVLVVAIASVLSSVALGGTAQAGRATNCAYRLDPISTTRHVIHAKLVKVGCYRTFAQALYAGSGGAIRVGSAVTPATLTEETAASRTELGTALLIGTEYVSTGFTGTSNDYFAPDACAGNTYEVAYVGDVWNDRFESGKGFGGCDHNKKFAASNFGGDVLTCTPNCTNYGTLADKVSSLRWKP